MNLGGLTAQHAAPMIAVVLAEEGVDLQDNALRDELARARASLPTGSYFSINSCSTSEYRWEYLSNHPMNASSAPNLENIPERVDALVAGLFKGFTETLGVTCLFFEGNPKLIQKWVVLIKNSNSNTTLRHCNYLSLVLNKSQEENCQMIRIESSNPREMTSLIDDGVIKGDICARMEGSSWKWLSEKARDYIKQRKEEIAKINESAQLSFQATQGDEVSKEDPLLIEVVKKI